MLGHLVAGCDFQALQHTIDNRKDFLALLILNWKFRLLVHSDRKDKENGNSPFSFSFF